MSFLSIRRLSSNLINRDKICIKPILKTNLPNWKRTTKTRVILIIINLKIVSAFLFKLQKISGTLPEPVLVYYE